jgi:hypothetical protein
MVVVVQIFGLGPTPLRRLGNASGLKYPFATKQNPTPAENGHRSAGKGTFLVLGITLAKGGGYGVAVLGDVPQTPNISRAAANVNRKTGRNQKAGRTGSSNLASAACNV